MASKPINPLPALSLLDVLQTIGFLLLEIPGVVCYSVLRRLWLPFTSPARPGLLIDITKSLMRRSMIRIPISVQRRVATTSPDKIRSSRRYGALLNTCQPVQETGFMGYWLCRGSLKKDLEPRDSDMVILYLHGGAYLFNHALENCAELFFLAETLERKGVTLSILSVEYTLAPTGRIPQQVQEVRAAYRYLVHTLGVDADKVGVFGESAGGHLALSFLSLLSDDHDHDHDPAASSAESVVPPSPLPIPGFVVLLSPWIDLSVSGPTAAQREPWDLLSKQLLLQATSLLMPGDTEQDHRRYLNFATAGPKWRTILPARTIITAHENELFADDISALVDNARADGCNVTYEVKRNDPWSGHCWQTLEAMLHRGKLLSRPLDSPVDDLMTGYQELAGLIAGLRNRDSGIVVGSSVQA